MTILLDQTDFSAPDAILEILLNLELSYQEIYDFANRLLPSIPNLHTNLEGRKFQVISQCILEALRLEKGFQSCEWISSAKLKYALKNEEKPICFSRINAKGQECFYEICNFEQIDFSKKIISDIDEDLVNQKSELNLNSAQTINNQVVSSQTINEKIQTQPLLLQNSNDNDNKILKYIINSIKKGQNLFITGHAGTGKSYILNKLKETFKKRLEITSTTGIAAVNVKGQTIHSWAGVGICRKPIEQTVQDILKSKYQIKKQIQKCKILAIDEISMLNIGTFEYVDTVLRLVRENNEPFGGIQVVFIGDFFQLPPVEKNTELENQYCFDSRVWAELNLTNILLTENYRQNEEDFINALSHMRSNSLSSKDIELLKSRDIEFDTSQTDILHIFSTNEEANNYNLLKFSSIKTPIHNFVAQNLVLRGEDYVEENLTDRENVILEIFNKNCRAENNIALKQGCRVMLLVNLDFEKGLINGSCGTVEAIEDESILIKFDNGQESKIPVHTFEYFYNEKIIAKRKQFPLKLAYGITIHKSQGMTLDKLVVDCGRIFERGQAYVAMSRVKKLDGLFIKNFSPNKVLTDEKVVQFYESLDFITPCSNIVEEEQINYIEEKNEDFSVENIILECVENFDGMYGKTGIAQILGKSKSFKESEYNKQVFQTDFYGKLEFISQADIKRIIEKLIDEKKIKKEYGNFGRPLLSIGKIS